MNPAIYIGTQEKYRLALRILFLGEKRGRRDSRRTSTSEKAHEYGEAKFYVRQISSSTDPPKDNQMAEHHGSDTEGILSGNKKITRQVSFK